MSEEFKQGQEVKGLWLADKDESYFEVGVGTTEKITVVMENGQMAGVPWFAVWRNGEIDSKWNGALVAGVKL